MPLVRRSDRFIEDGETPACGPVHSEWLTPPDSLTQFGAVIETLPPGSRSSIKHWHSNEDELVLVLDGEVTLLEGGEEHVLHADDAVTFRAGEPAGHCLENRSNQPCRYLVVGTRAAQDVITYPDHDRIAKVDAESDETIWTDLDGNAADSPYGRDYDNQGST